MSKFTLFAIFCQRYKLVTTFFIQESLNAFEYHDPQMILNNSLYIPGTFFGILE